MILCRNIASYRRQFEEGALTDEYWTKHHAADGFIFVRPRTG